MFFVVNVEMTILMPGGLNLVSGDLPPGHLPSDLSPGHLPSDLPPGHLPPDLPPGHERKSAS